MSETSTIFSNIALPNSFPSEVKIYIKSICYQTAIVLFCDKSDTEYLKTVLRIQRQIYLAKPHILIVCDSYLLVETAHRICLDFGLESTTQILSLERFKEISDGKYNEIQPTESNRIQRQKLYEFLDEHHDTLTGILHTLTDSGENVI